MPSGSYLYDGGTRERFSCAPGPAGWRFVSAADDGWRVDLTCDSLWRQLRVELALPATVLRGGVVGPEVLWATAGTGERSLPAAGFVARSPAFTVAVARRLGPQPGGVRVALARVGADGSVRAVEEHWRLDSTSLHEGLPVEHWVVTDVTTGEPLSWHLAGDVVVAGPGVELAELESPPNLVDGPGSPPTAT